LCCLACDNQRTFCCHIKILISSARFSAVLMNSFLAMDTNKSQCWLSFANKAHSCVIFHAAFNHAHELPLPDDKCLRRNCSHPECVTAPSNSICGNVNYCDEVQFVYLIMQIAYDLYIRSTVVCTHLTRYNQR
jgi:hypothetical protein